MLFAHTLLERLVEVFGKEGGAAIEEGCKRSHESTDESDGHDTLDTSGKYVLHHDGEGGVGLLHLYGTLLCQCSCNHTWDEEHEAREDLKETGCDSTAAGTLHHLLVALAGNLTEYTLNDVLVGTPVPETDDGGSEEHNKSRILLIHAVTSLPVEHMGCTVTIVQLVAIVHHASPSFTYATATKSGKTEEENEERTNNEDRSLYSGKCHHTLHTTKHGEDSCEDNKSDSASPEVQAPKIFEENTTCKGCHTHLSKDISHEGDDRKP